MRRGEALALRWRDVDFDAAGCRSDGHFRVRHDKIDANGKLTLRHNSRLYHIGMGRRHARTTVLVLVHDLHVRVLSTSGQLLRDLQLDPTRDYQPQAST